MVSTSSLPAVLGFQDRNYCYQSVVVQISHHAGLAPILYTGLRFFLSCIEPGSHPAVAYETKTVPLKPPDRLKRAFCFYYCTKYYF